MADENQCKNSDSDDRRKTNFEWTRARFVGVRNIKSVTPSVELLLWP